MRSSSTLNGSTHLLEILSCDAQSVDCHQVMQQPPLNRIASSTDRHYTHWFALITDQLVPLLCLFIWPPLGWLLHTQSANLSDASLWCYCIQANWFPLPTQMKEIKKPNSFCLGVCCDTSSQTQVKGHRLFVSIQSRWRTVNSGMANTQLTVVVPINQRHFGTRFAFKQRSAMCQSASKQRKNQRSRKYLPKWYGPSVDGDALGDQQTKVHSIRGNRGLKLRG